VVFLEPVAASREELTPSWKSSMRVSALTTGTLRYPWNSDLTGFFDENNFEIIIS
jgi:hypothetical protein